MSFYFIFQAKKLKENLRPLKESSSFQDFSRLGGQIYVNNPLSSSLGNLDPESEHESL